MIHLIACATVIEELAPFLVDDVDCRVLEFGLHADPNRLRATLQKEIDAIASAEQSDNIAPKTIVFGYGLCGKGLVGLRGGPCRLVIPRVDDCIGMCLGSRDAYAAVSREIPGTYYLTKGWMKAGKAEYEQMVEKYGKERTDGIYRAMFASYKSLGVVDTGSYPLDEVREYACRRAHQLGLGVKELLGTSSLLRRLINGPWSPQRFVICEPGQTTELEDFVRQTKENGRGLSEAASCVSAAGTTEFGSQH